MFSFIPLGLKTTLIVAAIGAIVAGGLFLYVKWQDNKISSLQKSIGALSSVVETQTATIKVMDENFKIMAEQSKKLGQVLSKIDKDSSKLQELLSRHNLGNLANKKPGLIESRVNKATKKEIKSLRNITDPDSYYKKEK